jgi:N-acetyl sugar amidotransferase
MIKYCTNCVMPNTKPDLFFDDAGVCAACNSFLQRDVIDWKTRKTQLENLLTGHRSLNGKWDCVIPVSGGKDSTYQVIKALEFGMNPLCVTATTCDLTEIGLRNIENIKSLGVDHIQFSPNPNVRKRLNRLGLLEVGDISWPEHVGIFTIPVRVAMTFGIKLIIWGENSQNEYGGPPEAAERSHLDRRWLEEFGGMLGLRVSDLVDVYGFTQNEIEPYVYPQAHDLEKAAISGLFLGQYLPWDGISNFLISQANGFITYDKSVEGSMVNYENLDNYQTGIHDYFKFLKFGFGRATDIACLHLRRGRITRDEAISIVKDRDGKFPHSYLGKSLEDILRPLDISLEQFDDICDRFTTRSLFINSHDGELLRDMDNNLQKTNYDNVV